MALEAAHACRTHIGRMHRPGRQVQPVTRAQLVAAAECGQPEGDGPLDHHEDLVEGVLVGRVPVAGAIAPGGDLDPLRGESGAGRSFDGIGHANGMRSIVGPTARGSTLAWYGREGPDAR